MGIQRGFGGQGSHVRAVFQRGGQKAVTEAVEGNAFRDLAFCGRKKEFPLFLGKSLLQ